METSGVTDLLIKFSDGKREAVDQLLPLIYDELKRIAASYLRRERSDHTLQPTALVNEAYMKMVDITQVSWQNKAHFIGVAANQMRRILGEMSLTARKEVPAKTQRKKKEGE